MSTSTLASKSTVYLLRVNESKVCNLSWCYHCDQKSKVYPVSYDAVSEWRFTYDQMVENIQALELEQDRRYLANVAEHAFIWQIFCPNCRWVLTVRMDGKEKCPHCSWISETGISFPVALFPSKSDYTFGAVCSVSITSYVAVIYLLFGYFFAIAALWGCLPALYFLIRCYRGSSSGEEPKAIADSKEL